MNFTPNKDQAEKANVPFYEDSTADYAPYYSSKKTLTEAENRVRLEMVKLKGVVTLFAYGKFDTDPPRDGVQIEFVLAGLPGVLKQAALPFRGEPTERKIERALVQALLNRAEWLKVSVTEPIFSPGSHPLVMKLLNPGGEGETIEEAMMSAPQIAGISGSVALLGPPDLGVIEGEFTEDEQ